MKIIFHNRLNEPQEVEVTRVVVLDSNENAVAAAIEIDSGATIVEVADEKNQQAFNALLRNLGLDKTVIVSNYKEKPVSELTI